MIARRKDRQTRRRGISIIEMLVVMTAVAAMLGLCAVLLQMLMKLDEGNRTRRDLSVTLGRLGEQFRADVHAAASVSAVEKAGLRLDHGGRKVEYRAEGDSAIVREERDGDRMARRERYNLPRCGPITMAIDRNGESSLARLTLQRRATRSDDEPPRPFEILARVGTNRGRSAGGGAK